MYFVTLVIRLIVTFLSPKKLVVDYVLLFWLALLNDGSSDNYIIHQCFENQVFEESMSSH